jgi:signal transduction histidine kinase
MNEGGTLTISTSLAKRQGRDHVRIDVADTGSGIPPQIQEKIFTPFFTTKAQGTGLGLPICYKLINLHNGFLTVSNNAPRGTVFTIVLPACNIHDIDDSRSEHEA